MVTLSAVPAYFAGQCNTVINDRDFDIVARNAILLLTALHFEPQAAWPIMLHIWYSALIPHSVLRSLQVNILPLVRGVCEKIKAKPPLSVQSKTWVYGSRSCRLVLQKQQWVQLLSHFQVPEGLPLARAQEIRLATTLAPERTDYVERSFFKKPPAWRVAAMKFRQTGILLPFGASSASFDTPNPYVS